MDKRPVLIVRMVESIQRNGVYRPTCGILQERAANMIIGIYPDGSMKVVKDRHISYSGAKVKLFLDRQGSEAPKDPQEDPCVCEGDQKCFYHAKLDAHKDEAQRNACCVFCKDSEAVATLRKLDPICPDCDGSGCQDQQRTIDLLLCHRCKGTGRVEAPRASINPSATGPCNCRSAEDCDGACCK